MTEGAKTAKSDTNENPGREDQEKALLGRLSITMDKRFDLAVSVTVALVGVLVLIETHGIRTGVVFDPVTPRGLPNMVGIILLVGGIVLAVRQLLKWSKLPGYLVPEEGQEDEKGYPVSTFRAFGIMLLSVLWVLLLKPLGFLIISPLSIFAASLVMGVRSWRNTIAFSIIFSVAVWVLFGVVLNVRYPLGPLDALARSLGLIL